MQFSPGFYREMGTWLNADLLDPFDEDFVRDRATSWAASLVRHETTTADLDRMVHDLDALLAAPVWDGPS